ncbi:unnamed protein product [Chrysodeixis includens]|uniref:Regucalcin n=1 Tax=Chrysodeixis includens TaxID=689277 RepID=A0A9N8L234_CHRIL|nr:unnamed protein product [Chrysodeixis includens]
MSPVITQVPVDLTGLGEAPHWDSDENTLYYVDIVNHTIHKYEPDTGKHAKAKLELEPHFILPVEGKKNHFLVTQGRKVVEIEWSGDKKAPKILRTITEVDHEHPTNLLNDGKADPLGRLFTGTIVHNVDVSSPKDGSLYRIDPDGTTTKLASDIICSNGLCWDFKGEAFYYIDSFSYAIKRYDYDVETGHISNPTTAFSMAEHGLEGFPDGMTIDTDGNLWVAVFWGSNILKIDPRKNKLLQTIPIPTSQVTSVTFGGPDLDVLYVTTAGITMKDKPDPKPPAGAIYALTGISARGYPNRKVRLNI